MPSLRIERVQKLLRAEISSILQRKLKDPRVGLVSITEVDVSPDLRNAQVFASVIGDPPAQSEAMAGLTSAAGFIRSELMRVLHLRPMPTLEFRLDQRLARASRTLDLLDEIRHERDSNPPARDDAFVPPNPPAGGSPAKAEEPGGPPHPGQ